MKDKIAIIASLLILAGGAYYVSTILKKKREITFSKESAIQYIVNSNMSSNASALADLEDSYLKTWALSIYLNKPEFEYNGNLYNTTGGRKIIQ